MDQQIFKANTFIALILPIIIAIGILVAFFNISSLPVWALVALIIPAFIAIHGHRTKVIVDDGILRYEQLFKSEEVELKNVSQIVTREVETIVDRRHDASHPNEFGAGHNHVNQEREVKRIVYVLDEAGRTFFSFPASLIGGKKKLSFKESVTNVNPEIQVA